MCIRFQELKGLLAIIRLNIIQKVINGLFLPQARARQRKMCSHSQELN